ncbi:MAG: hypothetical protein ACRD1Q_03160, partial [Vicinamibacterales bacterium]
MKSQFLRAWGVTAFAVMMVLGDSLPAQVTNTSPGSATGWATARTPWGDPDLQGNYTNKYEYGTPFERPAAFKGRRAEDVTPQELAAVVQDRQQDALDRAKFFGGDPEGRIGNSAEFR